MIKRLLLFLAAFLFPILCWALAKTTAGDGDWNTGGTWTGGVKCQNGDTCTINHNVTVSTSEIVGTSPAMSNIVLTISDAKTLTIQSGGTLAMRGDGVATGSGQLILQAGSTFTFDASLAAAPATTYYKFHINANHNETAYVIMTGTSGSRVTVNSNKTNSGANGSFDDGPSFLKGGMIKADFVNFTNIGTSTIPAMIVEPSSGRDFWVKDSVFDTCGKIANTFNLDNGINYTLQRNQWKNTPGDCFRVDNTANDYTTGTRLVDQNVFDSSVYWYNPYGFTATANFFYKGIGILTGRPFTSFDSNFVRRNDAYAADMVVAGPTTNNYFLYHQSAKTNPHFIQVETSSTVTGNIFEFDGADDAGDCIVFGTNGAAWAVTVSNNLVLKNGGTGSAGTLFSQLGDANLTITCNHNTVYEKTQGALVVGETYAGRAGTLASARSNLVWNDQGGTNGYKIADSGGDDAVVDLVTSANANYNAGYGLLAGSDLKGYNNLEFSAGAPGANDIDGSDPKFFAPTRNCITFDSLNGGAGTIANLLTEMMKRNGTGFNSAYTVESLLTFVKNGFRTGQILYKDAGHDGATIGAQDYFSGKNPGAISLLGAG